MKPLSASSSLLALFRMGFFRATHGWWGEEEGGQKETWHSCTLPKEDPKNI